MRGLGALGLATALLLPAPASGAAPLTQDAATTSTRVSALAGDLARYARTRSDTFSVGVYDENGRHLIWYRPASAYDNASIVKVNILETVLWRAQEAHRWLTSWEQQQSARMIRNSDNDAATALWNHVGQSRGVAAYDHVIGLRDTTFDDGGAWGLTRSVVRDQIVLLRAVGAGAGPLASRARSYVRTQMANVESDQRWGVSAGVPAGSTVELKNGWLPRSTHGWRINSIGHIRSGSRHYELVFLSTDNASMSYGVATAQGVSRIVYRDLGASVPG